MKKILLKTISLLMMALAPLAMPAVNTIIHTVTYDFSQMSIGTDTLGGVTYTTVNYAGLYNDGAPGTPSLPVDYLRFSVPWNATNFSVTTSVRNNVITNLKYLVYPCQPHWLMDDTTQHPVTLPDSSAYYSNSEYPSQRAWVVDEGFLAGENHIVTVAVMPVSFINSGTGTSTIRQLIESRTVTLTLHYNLSDSLAMYPIVRQDTVLRQEGYRLAQSMVVNPNNVAVYAPTDVVLDSLGGVVINPEPGGDGMNGGGLNPPDPGVISNDSISEPPEDHYFAGDKTYLIVTTSDLYHSTRRIAALKRQEGYNVSVVTMEDVLNSPYSLDGDRIEQEGGTYKLTYTDDAGKLRQYLKHRYQTGTQYVFLVGDGVPYRYITLKLDAGQPAIDVPSDVYFSSLNSDWSDSLIYKDRYPDLYVGRLLATSSQQVNNNTEKSLRYELNPGAGERSYLQSAFFLEGREFLNYLNPPRDSLSLIYPNQIIIRDSIGSASHLEGKDVIDTISINHVGFISIVNHGASKQIRVYGEKSDTNSCYFIYAHKALNNGNGLNCLRNKNYPMVFYALSCKTMPYDNQNGVNFGESFTTGKDYGGPIYIGYTRTSHGLTEVDLFKGFTRKLRNGYFKLGEAVALSKAEVGGFIAYCHAFINGYLGDPSLELWTGLPQDYSNVSITRGNSSITVSGIGVDSTMVTICGNSAADIDLVRRNYLSNSSITFNNVSPNCLVMLHKHNMIPYIAPLVLQKVDLNRSQYVIASDVLAGRSVDSDRTHGDVTVKSGIEYEIEASGTVMLEGGFNVEKGATFAVYPSCF